VTLGLGVLAIVGSVIVIASGGSALVLIGAALALSSGIAAVGGSTAIIVSDAFTDVSPEEIGRQTDMLNLAVGYASGIGPLVGGTFALVYAGDEQGFARGVAIGGLVEFGLTASFYGSRALYNTSSYGKAEAALKLPEFQVADDVLLAARADEVRRLERAGFSEAPWEIGTSPLAGVESQLGRSVGAAQEGSLRLPWENLRNRGDLLRVAREVRNRAEFSVRENPGLIRDYFELGPPSIGVDFNLDDVYSVLRAEDLAQQVQTQWATHGIDPGLRPFAAVAISKNGHVVTGISMRGFELELHSQVIDEYNNIVQAMQSPYHLRCGEALCLSKALETLGFDLRGAASAAVQIHAPGHPCYLQWLQPCESCAPVLSAFGVRPAR
jgi:hypothetical protein